MHDYKCEKCGVRNIIPDSIVGFRLGSTGAKNGLLCWKCCKEIHWNSKFCKMCVDLPLCEGKLKEQFKQKLDENKGVK